jgi:hypothetical protein
MDNTVSVPTSLLDDIFRLLDYLDPRYDRVRMHFNNSGYRQRFEHDNTLCQLWIKIGRLQLSIVDTYLLTIGDITEVERRDLDQWVAQGNSVYDNPYTLYDERGQPMDYINGCRVGIDMAENPSLYGISGYREDGDMPWSDDELSSDDELPWDDDEIPF